MRSGLLRPGHSVHHIPDPTGTEHREPLQSDQAEKQLDIRPESEHLQTDHQSDKQDREKQSAKGIVSKKDKNGCQHLEKSGGLLVAVAFRPAFARAITAAATG